MIRTEAGPEKKNKIEQKQQTYTTMVSLCSNAIKVMVLAFIALVNVLFFMGDYYASLRTLEGKHQYHQHQYEKTTMKTTRKQLEADAQRIVDKWSEKIPDMALTTERHTTDARLPTKEQPFYFFHQRKAGGSTIRDVMRGAAEKYKLEAWIACETHPCVPFSNPPSGREDRFAIYASHINYALVRQLLLEQTTPVNRKMRLEWEEKNADYESRMTSTDPDGSPVERSYMSTRDVESYISERGTCLTNIRPTVSRVFSCWNFRMYEMGRINWNLPQAKNMAADDWLNLLPEAVDTYGNGCSNEIARVFGSSAYEPDINTLKLEDDRFMRELDRTLMRMGQCVVIRVDRCEDSNLVLKHFLPWMETDLCGNHKRESKVAVRAKTDDLPEDITNAILERNWFDKLAFDFGEELFEEQLRIAQRAEESDPDGKRSEKILEKLRQNNNVANWSLSREVDLNKSPYADPRENINTRKNRKKQKNEKEQEATKTD
mmetsp:Transcript_18549/g.42832  ORF Transcript_18549/g.42832 Transcript_18549/m.42832 type:complete len:488 (-) Transcript_18549:416-1879(-)